jgi:mono/diheme cytochrome c family protein
MRGTRRWLVRGSAALALLAALAAAAVWTRAELVIRERHDTPLQAFVAPNDPASIARGARLVRILGCAQGCHGETGIGGGLFMDDEYGKLYAPDLTRAAARMSDAELERVLRHGLRQDGTSVWAMPSDMFQHLDDGDLGAVIAWLRTQPMSAGPTDTMIPSMLTRWEIATGEFTPFARQLPQVHEHAARPDGREPRALGRYLALTVCSECHGQDLKGRPGDTPDLAVVAAYPLDEFTTLMRTGVPIGGRDLNLMDEVALSRFAHFTDDEIAALHAYLGSKQGD